MSEKVTLYIDPTCPYAWMTSRWLLNATEQTEEFEAHFAVMSLSVLNEGRELDSNYLASMQKAWNPARLALKIQQEANQADFANFYTAWGERFHVQGQKTDYYSVAKAALASAKLPDSYLEIWDSAELDDELRKEQAKVEQLVGNEVGTPVISFKDSIAYFGPVISPAPKGDAALELLRAMHSIAKVEGFFELKRARTNPIDFS